MNAIGLLASIFAFGAVLLAFNKSKSFGPHGWIKTLGMLAVAVAVAIVVGLIASNLTD